MNRRIITAGFAAMLMAGSVGAVWNSDGPEHDLTLLPEFAEIAWDGPQGPIFVARYEVTIREWNRCVDDGACVVRVKARPGFDASTTPATGLNWLDAMGYVDWMNRASGHPVRLPTIAEWSGLAASVLPEKPDPIFTDPALSWASAYLTELDYPRALKATGSFSESPEGISDLDGPVWEWTANCYDAGVPTSRCAAFYAGGLHESVLSALTRDPARGGCAVGAPPAHLGLRLVSEKKPPTLASR
ncbi:MAG: formylglycine-generating enzyme family protein [Boseongicola sp.]|nr:formylglycine-generating enzyme family protein [Boseongicola sp.]NNJ68341.1 SUMF1/EgtB/PvdO family nonheme iron enzyme [Boseongicola sp.]